MQKQVEHVDAAGTGVHVLSTFERAMLVAGLLSMGMGQTMLFAILPPAARDLHLTEVETGLIITTSAFFFMVAAPMWGRLCDTWGRRPAFSFGLISYGLTTLAFTLVLAAGYNSYAEGLLLLAGLIIARVAFSLLTGGIQTGATAMLADTTTAEKRTAGMALVGASFGIGSVLGPALVALLAGFGLLAPLFAVSGLAVAMGIVARFTLPETSHRKARGGPAVKLSALDPRLLPVLLVSFATFLCISMHNQSFGFYVQDMFHGTSAQTATYVGYGYIALGIAMIVAQGVIVQFLKPPPTLLLKIGPVLGAIGYALFLQGDTILMLVAALAVSGLGIGMLQAGIISTGSLRVSPAEQGGAAGWLSAAPGAGFLVGPTLSAVIYTTDHRYPFILITIVLTIVAVSAWQITVPKAAHR